MPVLELDTAMVLRRSRNLIPAVDRVLYEREAGIRIRKSCLDVIADVAVQKYSSGKLIRRPRLESCMTRLRRLSVRGHREWSIRERLHIQVEDFVLQLYVECRYIPREAESPA